MRAFIAMDVRDEGSIGNMLSVQSEFMGMLNGRPVSREQLHFTLLFLGEIDNIMLERVKERLSSIRFEPVSVIYRGVGVFPSVKRPRVIWIGVDTSTASRLTDIAREVEERLRPLGFTSDKPFTPHITILRVREGSMIKAGYGRTRGSGRDRDVGDMLTAMMNRYSDALLGSDTLDEIKIKRSDLRPDGPVYTDMFILKASHG